tara:strand:+ start:518 stop:730 length:213 start_codon:yes stop_codon:yes gene_type:complete
MDNIKAMKMFLAMGGIMNQKESREDKLKYKERIVFATMRASIPEWQPPSDWDELPIEERETRLTNLEQIK